ncbi:unnamed protein product [Caenorhabditis bovis]|uniref:Non-lysosomal glucosylceramidase n=1 Tax=Caenorhabditis bovis TaxID=2654633 RepID=A0A8S1E3D0_9PELO|nr:unnamed protein product [Caenorhabditis bovis]
MECSPLDGIGWTAEGNREPEITNCRPFFPRIKHAVRLIPMVIRICMYTFKEWWGGREAFINIFKPLWHFTYAGVPLGGIGCGSIGTDYRGAFGRFSIIPGIKEQMCDNIKANQFIVTVRSLTGVLIYQSLLSCAEFSSRHLKCWKTMPAENTKYRGLYPRAWRKHTLGNTNITIIVEQLSPILPHNYEDSSLPVANFEFTVINNATVDVDVSITFTFRNGTGNKKWNAESVCKPNKVNTFNSTGMTLSHTVCQMPVTYGVMAKNEDENEISTGTFDPNGTGLEVLDSLRSCGSLKELEENLPNMKELAVAVCSKFSVSSNSRTQTRFSLAWYTPEVHFGTKQRKYLRRYTRFFNGKDDSQVTARIADHAIVKFEEWRNIIEQWQLPVLKNGNLPDWYKSALFNELYYVSDGSCVWFEYDDNWKQEETLMSNESIEHFNEFGRFGYMESWEYFMFNTYDVHFYSSWAFLKNWPEIEMSIQLDFCDQICRTDNNEETSMAEGTNMLVKRFARVPHDMGHPLGDPWIHTNAYILHDTSDWKDLNLKFVISCWRDHSYIAKNRQSGIQILKNFYEKSKLIIERALSDWDIDGDQMIENSGFADQTYDVWTMTGTSAYCGSLWLAALSSFIQMAEVVEEKEEASKYREILKVAGEVYIKKLWNGRYFSFDENPENQDVIMADQLSGIWALSMCNLDKILEDEKITSALSTVFKFNVEKYQNCQLGAVNGYLSSGKVDTSSIQSEEVWSGITYALSSFMIEMGLTKEAFKTSEGLFNGIWCRHPLQYQTPEAIVSYRMYRAIGYMRPLSIWAMQHSIERKL